MKIDLMQLKFIDLNLRKIATSLEKEFNVEFEITSLLRLPIGGASVHQQLPLRGVDIGITNYHFGVMVRDYVNTLWTYDRYRPHKNCAIYGDLDHINHIHLQTHSQTVKNNEYI